MFTVSYYWNINSMLFIRNICIGIRAIIIHSLFVISRHDLTGEVPPRHKSEASAVAEMDPLLSATNAACVVPLLFLYDAVGFLWSFWFILILKIIVSLILINSSVFRLFINILKFHITYLVNKSYF